MNKELAKALRQIPNGNSESVSHIEVLANSITSTSYLVHLNQQKYVLRLDKTFDQGVIPDRDNELRVLKFLNKHSLTNKLVHSDLAQGLLITEYIDAQIINIIDNDINKLAHKLKAIHSLKSDSTEFHLRSGVSRYAKVLETEQAMQWSQQIMRLLDECQQRSSVLCHNDLHTENILETHNKELMFIDWEYAGLGNPLFDVSSLLQSLELSNSQSELFLKTYFGEPTDREREDIQRFKHIHDLLLALWLSVLIKSSESQGKQDLISTNQLELVKIRLNT